MSICRGLVAATAALVILAVSGCSLVDDVSRTTGSLVDGATISAALDGVRAELESIEGVTVTQSDSEIQPDYAYRVTLVATAASELAEDDALTVMEAVRDAFSSDALSGQATSFQLESDTTPMTLNGAFITAEQLVDEMTYYSDFASAYGSPLGLSITSSRDEEGVEFDYVRGIRSLGGAPGDPSALLDVDDTSTGSHEWELAGLGATGILPEAEVFALLDSFSAVAPVLDYASTEQFTGIHLQWDGAMRILDVGFTVSAPDAGADIVSSPSLDVVRELVALSAESGIRVTHFSYSTDDGSVFAIVSFDGCDAGTQPVSTPLDQELAAVVAPTAVIPGFCPV